MLRNNFNYIKFYKTSKQTEFNLETKTICNVNVMKHKITVFVNDLKAKTKAKLNTQALIKV